MPPGIKSISNPKIKLDILSPDDIDPNWMPVQEFLEKPVDMEKLLEKVRQLLQAN